MRISVTCGDTSVRLETAPSEGVASNPSNRVGRAPREQQAVPIHFQRSEACNRAQAKASRRSVWIHLIQFSLSPNPSLGQGEVCGLTQSK